MPNVSEADKLYAAGFFDGEGCVLIVARAGLTGQTYYSLHVSVSQKKPEILFWFLERWGGCISRERRVFGEKTFKYSKWVVQSRMATVFLQDILPYLRGKRQEAEVGIRFQSRKSRSSVLRQSSFVEEAQDRLLLQEMKRA